MMHEDYRFISRKGRYIQVMFKINYGHWYSTGTLSMKEAVLWAERWLDEYASGKTKGGMRFENFARDFFTRTDAKSFRRYAEMRGEFRGEKHYQARQGIVDNYLIPRFGRMRLEDINEVDIEDFVLSLKSKRSGALLSASSRNLVIYVMERIMHEARRQGYIHRNPVKDVPAIPRDGRRRESFTKEELALMFPASDDEAIALWGSLMWATYFYVMRDTGFRPGEVAGLSVSCWEPDLHGFHTAQSVDASKRAFKARIKTTDSGVKEKVGLVSDQTERFVRLLIKDMNADDMLFLSPFDGGLLATTVPNKVLGRVQKSLGFTDIRTQYSLRHSFETEMLKKIDDRAVAILMGHMRYRKEYDHRTGADLLRQIQDTRKDMFES